MTYQRHIIIGIIYKIMESTKIIIKKWMPDDGWLFIKSFFPGQAIHNNMVKNHVAEWQSAREKHPWIRGSTEFASGVNLVGYLRTVKGIGEAARSSMMALEAGNIPHTVNDFEFGIPAHQQTEPLPDLQSKKGFPFNTNLLHINPPQLPYLHSCFNKGDLISRYNIGVWYWELPEFPDEWCFAFELVDEVWAATQFILESISAKSSVPVVKIPPCIDTMYNKNLNRSDFGLPADRFLFMCAYDVLSIQARKNPELRVVDDQVGNPTWARALAEMIGRLLTKAGDAPFGFFEKNAGVYHLAGRGYVSRFDLAKEIIALASIREPGLVSSIQPARTADFPAPAQRPLFSALDCSKFESTFDLRLPEWQDALKLALGFNNNSRDVT